MFVFQTPTVRLTADSIEVIAEGATFVPTGATVEGDPGSAEYTTLELTWVEDGIEQRLFVYFRSDGTSWWADEIRTRDGTEDAEWVTAQGEWFRSPLGTPWVGDLDLPNLRITNMALEAFRRPDACTNPTAAMAVVPAYSSIDGLAIDGAGFAFRVDLIDTSNCTLVDPTPYVFVVSVDDTSVAAVVGQDSTPPMTSVEGAAGEPTLAAGRIELAMVGPGETTVRVTVSDSSGTEVGTVAVPVRVQASEPIATPTTAMWSPGDS